MDANGLPLTFGKQVSAPKAHPSVSTQHSQASTSAIHITANDTLPPRPRGEASGRGERGVVGGGKKSKRGRGAAPAPPPSIHGTNRIPLGIPGAQRLGFEGANGGASDYPPGSSASMSSNEGLKRPHPNSAPNGDGYSPLPRGDGFTRGRGRGRGGHEGRGGGHSSGRDGNGGDGLFKMSMCEDPWKELIEQRARRRGQE